MKVLVGGKLSLRTVTQANPSEEKFQEKAVQRLLRTSPFQTSILGLWTRIRTDWMSTEAILRDYFRSEPSLGKAERGFIRTLVYGMIRRWAQIRACLKKVRSRRPQDELTVYFYLEGHLEFEAAKKTIPKLQEVGQVGLLPEWLKSKLAKTFPDSIEGCLQALEAPVTRVAVRVNTLNSSRNELKEILAQEEISCEESALVRSALIVPRGPLEKIPAFERGAFEVQSLASQLVVQVMVDTCPSPQVIVDYCAGAGGKTLALAAAFPEAKIVAADVDEGKLKTLRKRAARAGAKKISTVLINEKDRWPEVLQRHVASADLVLVDAPCSGSGRLRQEPQLRWSLTEASVREFARLQREILSQAGKLVKEGGTLAYVTCSLFGEENQEVLAGIKGRWQTIAPKGLPDSARKADWVLIAPHIHETDGMFLGLLQKNSTSQ